MLLCPAEIETLRVLRVVLHVKALVPPPHPLTPVLSFVFQHTRFPPQQRLNDPDHDGNPGVRGRRQGGAPGCEAPAARRVPYAQHVKLSRTTAVAAN